MRLLDTGTLSLVDFTSKEKPPYGILSHTWAEEEVTYQEMMAKNPHITAKAGYRKIKQFCALAALQGEQYVWVDTCCIDKSSSAELSEAINSMFKWYANARFCYVYLVDTPSGKSHIWMEPDLDDRTRFASITDAMGRCRWFGRGWTLQELLASKTARFFDSKWKPIGYKQELYRTITAVTGVPQATLEAGPWQQEHSVAARMSWAANRQTTREEDIAYSLLGVFGVNIGLIYGEGHNAFRRLQEDIIKRSNDLTIFAWDEPRMSKPLDFQSLFATTPASFVNAGHIVGDALADVDFALTNLGLRFSGPVVLSKRKRHIGAGRYVPMYLLRLGQDERTSESCALHLRKIGPHLYYRDARFSCALSEKISHKDEDSEIVSNPYIAADFSWAYQTKLIGRRKHDQGIIRAGNNATFTVVGAVPQSLWDIYDSCFLNPPDFSHDVMLALMVDIVLEDKRERFLFLCAYYLRQHSKYYICHVEQYRPIAELLFDLERRENSIRRSELLRHAPEFAKLHDSCVFKGLYQSYRISCTFDNGSINVAETSVFCRDLAINISPATNAI